MPAISLIGAPTDIGASVIGARLGPGALRIAGLQQALESFGNDVRDLGDLVGPDNPLRPPVDGYRHLPEVIEWNRLLRDAVAAELADGRLPIVLGGDHCLAIGSIAAVSDHARRHGKNLRIIWLDAHADINTASITPTGNLHGMPVACLAGTGPDELVSMAERIPAIEPDDIRQIGLRSVDDGEKHTIHDLGVEVFDMRFVDEIGMRATMERALHGVDESYHVHVSFDVDFLDAELAPGVGTAVHGGPTYREAQLCMEMIADTGLIGSLDVVELNPALDVRNRTANVAVDLIESLFGKSTLLRVHTPVRHAH